jgi:hypothetical protein
MLFSVHQGKFLYQIMFKQISLRAKKAVKLFPRIIHIWGVGGGALGCPCWGSQPSPQLTVIIKIASKLIFSSYFISRQEIPLLVM